MCYFVYMCGNGDMFVLMCSGENDGQKYFVMMCGYWFYVLNMCSVVCINGMQWLQGEVVISDIMCMYWVDSYCVMVVFGMMLIVGKLVIEFDLIVIDFDNVYLMIKLWVMFDIDVLLCVQFFFVSGLLFCSVDFFVLVDLNGCKVICKIMYCNEVEKQCVSVVDIFDGQLCKILLGWFNFDMFVDGQ